MEVETMMQGDSYVLEIEILNEDDVAVTDADVSDVEITIGHLSKTYKDGAVSYEDGKWIFPLTQEETFKFPASAVPAQLRIVWPNGQVEGVNLGKHFVSESISKEVL
jgi:hypothetical protein